MATMHTIDTTQGVRVLDPSEVRDTVLKYRGRCLHVLGKQTGSGWSIAAYNPSFDPDIPPTMLNRAPRQRPGEQTLLAYNNAAGDWERGDTGLVVTDQALHLAIADWALAPDPPKGRIARLLKSPPVQHYRIELADLERVAPPGGLVSLPGLVINNTYRIPVEGQQSPWALSGWQPEQVLKAVLTDIMELRLPPAERTPKGEAWFSGRRANMQPVFPPRCIVCLEQSEAMVPMEVPSTEVRVPGYGRQYAWSTRTFEPGVPFCKKHKPWGNKVQGGKGPGIEAYYLADYAWQLSGLRDVVKGLKNPPPGASLLMSDVMVQSLRIEFKNREYLALFCEANGITPG